MKKTLSLLLSISASMSFAQTIDDGKKLNETQIEKIHQAVESNLSSEQKEALNAKYLYGNGEQPNNWHFVYGPLGEQYKNKTLKFYAIAPNGSAEFVCKSNGMIYLFYSLIEYNKPQINSVQNISLNVGGTIHTLPSLVQSIDTHSDRVFYSVEGTNVLGILSTMNKLFYDKDSTKDIQFNTGSRELSFPSPSVKEDTKASFLLCGKWYQNSLNTNEVKKEDN